MSHFTTVKTVIRDQETLRETLQQLHYNFQVGERLPIPLATRTVASTARW